MVSSVNGNRKLIRHISEFSMTLRHRVSANSSRSASNFCWQVLYFTGIFWSKRSRNVVPTCFLERTVGWGSLSATNSSAPMSLASNGRVWFSKSEITKSNVPLAESTAGLVGDKPKSPLLATNFGSSRRPGSVGVTSAPKNKFCDQFKPLVGKLASTSFFLVSSTNTRSVSYTHLTLPTIYSV